MATFTRLMNREFILSCHGMRNVGKFRNATSFEDGEFRVFDLRNRSKKEVVDVERYIKPPPPPPRELQMPTNQDWSNVWPGPRTFHPASVPLPVKQGYDKKNKLPPCGKYANAELMKLPNFLHLTPPAIKKHCKVLQRFCTPWPKNLENDSDIDKHFPVSVTTSDYCHSSPKIRDTKARVVTFQFKLSNLSLNSHAKDKIQRLLGDRYDECSDMVTLVTDRCPLRKQNYDYNQYLLLALFYESWKNENWEVEKLEEDMEYYDWDRNNSKKVYIALKTWTHLQNEQNVSDSSLRADDIYLSEYRQAVSNLFNQGETIHSLFKYKEVVLKVVM